MGDQPRLAALAKPRSREVVALSFLPFVWHILCTSDLKTTRKSPDRFGSHRRAAVMNTERRSCVTHDARSTCDVLSGNIPGDAIPPTNTTRLKRFETPEDIARALRVAPTRSDWTLRRVVAVLMALVGMCLVMAAVVWWRLLT
jgi:hypothetical protein